MIALLAALTTFAHGVVGSADDPSATAEDRTSTEQALQDFSAANERALAGDINEAIALYRSLLDRGFWNEDVLFNLGNAHVRGGQPIEAIVAYERALKLAPAAEDIRANLEHVRATLFKEQGRALEVAGGSLDLADALVPVLAPLDENFFGWLAISANALLFLLLATHRRSILAKARHAFFVGIALCAVVTALSVSVVAGHAIVAQDKTGLMVKVAPLRQGPDERFESKGENAAGSRVRILSEDADWLEIQRLDGTTGWVPANTVAGL